MRNITRLALLLGLAPLSACSEAPRSQASQTLGEMRQAIINGTADSGAEAHESVVLLGLMTEGALCSGSLIAPNLVLTARHCVSKEVGPGGVACNVDGTSGNGDQVGNDLEPGSIVVFTGQEPNSFGGGVASGTKIYHPTGNILCNHDIALVLLSNAVPGVTPMSLRFAFGPQIGEITTPVGYGKTSNSDFSAGARYRRPNTPIVSVGQDINFSTATNEFVMAQSTCQGDSGGPVLAGDTGAIIGVTSRGSDCFNGYQQFTRVDAHKALIQQALTDAGATAVLEVKTPPAKQPKTKTGTGPCFAGSECEDLLCINPGSASAPSGVCSGGCIPGSCEDGTVCKTAQASVQEGSFTAQLCVAQPKDNACETCRYNKCKMPIETCLADDKCAPFVACADACTTADCYASCETSNPQGAALYKEVHTCECGSKCSTSCSSLCGTMMGAGGAAGAGGSGQAGSAGSGDAGTAGAGGEAGSGEAGSGGVAGSGGEAGSGEAGMAPQAGAAGTIGKAGAAGKGGTGGKAGTGGKGGSAGTQVDAAGSDQAGGAGGSGASATGTPQVEPADSSSSGGCSTAPRPGQAGGWGLWVLGVAALSRRVRREIRREKARA